MIDLVPYENIDKKAYDRCVSDSENFRIYATSSYLDAAAQNWDAFVYKDYQAVMPVPRKKKYGLSYVYTPNFIQQLGVFSPGEVSEELEHDFGKRLASRFILVDYAFHSGSHQALRCEERVNYTLDLSRDYEGLFQDFNTNRKRIIRKGFHGLTLDKSSEPEVFLSHLEHPDLSYKPDASSTESLRRLIDKNPEVVRTWSVYNDDQWVGGLLWLQDHRRITYLFPVASEKGKELDAPTFILTNLIQEHQGTDLLLDLEGSMIPGVARFYKSFGAQPEPYSFMKSRFYGLF